MRNKIFWFCLLKYDFDEDIVNNYGTAREHKIGGV